ncbi:unnamed protein product [Mytilus edulis]|uniref:Integrase zinc-binding domain-containing protein n=1 Tax=Mytilus edulis TaxID=6550 RepID=A0A8S3TL33_MYTED|nr:unnamed protein product [Mytilus edulis]
MTKNLQIVRQWVQDGHKPNLKNLGEYNYVIKSLWSQFDDLKIQDGVLCKVHRDNNKSRVIVPLTERRRILQQCHDNKTSGHLGIKKTQSRIKDRFYWPGVRHDIVAYIAGCEICAKRKGPNKRQRAPMQSAQHETTGCTPNRMMLGREVATPVDLMYDVPDYLKKIPQNRWAWELQERMEEAHHFVRKHVGQEMVRVADHRSHVDRMRLCKGQLLRGETERNENNDDTFEPESVLPEIFNEELDSADNIVDQSDSRDEPNLLSLDLSHNNLSDLLDVVRKLGTLPKLRNLILQGNPLALIAGYRGYTIDSLRKLNILDDIMISADEKHHYKGLARRREYILDEAKVTLEVGYIKGVPLPDEIKRSLTKEGLQYVVEEAARKICS